MVEHWLLFLGFYIVAKTGNVFLFLLMIQKGETLKHWEILFILWWWGWGYAPSCKSDSLLFQCSFYYFSNHLEREVPVNIMFVSSDRFVTFLSPYGQCLNSVKLCGYVRNEIFYFIKRKCIVICSYFF
jgi:hypothetical protein